MAMTARRRSRGARGESAGGAPAPTPEGLSGEPVGAAPWAEAACLLAGVLTPLAFHTFGTLGFEATKGTLVRLLALILALGWLAASAWRLRLPPQRPDVAAIWRSVPPPARLLGMALAGYVTSQVPATALSIAPSASLWGSYDRIQGLWTLLAWVTLGLGAAVAGRPVDRRRALVTAWLLASVPVCLYAVAQQFGLDPVDWLGRQLGVSSTLGSSTALSTYLAMLLPLTLARVVQSGRGVLGRTRADSAGPSGRRRAGLALATLVYAGWVALLGVQLVVLAFAQVRGGALAAPVGLGVAATAIAWRRRRRVLPFAIAGSAALVVAGFLALSVPGLPGELRDSGGWEDSSARQRLLIWQASLETVAASGWRAVVGFGPETQALALEARFPVELSDRFPDARFDRAHNVLIDQLLTSGLLGVAALVALIVALVRVGVGVPASEVDEAVLAGGLLGGLAANLAAGFYAFDSMSTGTLFWLMAGLLASPVLAPRPALERAAAPRSREGPSDARAPMRPRVTIALAAASLGLATLPALLGPLLADLYHTRALALRAGEAPAASVGEELLAIRWAPERDVYAIALGQAYLEIARTTHAPESAQPGVFEDLYDLTPTGHDGLLRAARLSMERVAARSPLDPYSHLYVARVRVLRAEATRDPSERAAELAAAAASFDRAISLSPRRAQFYDEAASALLRLGRIDEAIGRYRAAEGLDRTTSERLARIGDAEAARGDPEAARARYAEALALDPRSAAAEHGLALLARGSGDLGSAAEHAERAARFQMRNWLYHRDLALIYRDLEDWPPALAEARAARRWAPAWEWDDLTALIEVVRR